MKDKNLHLELTDKAIDRMMAQGYDPVYGARPMKRLLQAKIETLVSRAIIQGDLTSGQTLVVDADDKDGFIIR